jgi:hypothetical protein
MTGRLEVEEAKEAQAKNGFSMRRSFLINGDVRAAWT